MIATRLCMLMCAVFAVGAAAATAGEQRAHQGQGFKVAGRWGKSGSANGQFLDAFGITTDGGGLVYVADRDNNRLQVFTAKGGFVRKWGSQGEGKGQFTSAQNVAIGPDGSVWAADLKNGRVQQFSKDGGFETELGTPKQADRRGGRRRGQRVRLDGRRRRSTRSCASTRRRRGIRARRRSPARWRPRGTSRCRPTGASTSPTRGHTS